MAKPKEEEEEVKLDGLEITSIGSLYKGPWEKKYWSSSRGKDRYPYPVGFQAVRAHNGSTCKMEIQEGPKGPLFLITSADGHSLSGQTPDIAWDKFQKKRFPRTKIWHGKRFSCKIDGVEFFGFKNSFVQRLLRELVANINGTAEQSLLASSLGNGAPGTDCDHQCRDSCAYADLLSYWARPQITKKRSRRHDFRSSKAVSRSGLKRPRAQDLTLNAENSKSVELCEHLREVAVPAQEETKLANSESGESARVANNLAKEERLSVRSQNTIVEGLDFQPEAEENAQNASVPILEASPGFNNIDLCAPDTLDFVQDSAAKFSPCSQNRISYMKEETAADMIISERLLTESHPGQIGTSNSNANAERSEFDSVGQEIAKSMMTVLLPQAIPLLKKRPRKKKETISSSVNVPLGFKSREENNDSNHFVDVKSPAALPIKDAHVEEEEEMDNQIIDIGLVVSDSEHSKSGVLDSNLDVILSHNLVEAHQDSFARDIYPPITREELVGSDVQESSACHVESCGSKDIFCYDELCMASNEKPQKSHDYIPESVLGCTSPSKNILSEEIQDVCANLDIKSDEVEIHSVEKDMPDCTKGNKSSVQLLGKDIRFETGPSETSFVNQVPYKVYTRKKATKADPSIRKYNGPLSESIICRKFEDDCVPGTHHSTESVLALKTHHMSSYEDKPQKEDLLASEARLGGQSHCFHRGKTTMNSTLVTNNTVPISEGKNMSNHLYSSVPHVEKYEVDFDKNLLGHKTTNFCDNERPRAWEVETTLDLEPHTNVVFTNELGSFIELVGCYFHPMPVLSLLLSTKGTEIYICVICGCLMDKDKDKDHTLFTYKVGMEGQAVGHPSFVGHTAVMFSPSRSDIRRKITLEDTVLQFTPDGQCIVLLDSIKTPYCREGRIDCLCSTCMSSSFEENAVKIVKVKSGYVSIMEKLKTIDDLKCILVCAPDHLVAGGESGKLHLWTMNSTWSAQTEEFVIPANHGNSCIVELKRIPNYASLVIGHNGFGEFSLWDIRKQVLISTFSAPSPSVSQFFPISLFNWQSKDHAFSNSDIEEQINRIMAATKLSSAVHNGRNFFIPSEGEDAALWLLVSTLADSDDHHEYISTECPRNRFGSWRLALLMNNMMILGSTLDPRAAAIGASAGHGIIGTHEGVVYMWELSTGTKLGTVHHFRGGSVSCIATDDSRTGIFAVADDRGQLLVYLHHSKSGAHE